MPPSRRPSRRGRGEMPASVLLPQASTHAFHLQDVLSESPPPARVWENPAHLACGRNEMRRPSRSNLGWIIKRKNPEFESCLLIEIAVFTGAVMKLPPCRR